MRAQGIDLYIDTPPDNSSLQLTDYQVIIAIVKQSEELRHPYRCWALIHAMELLF
jgi:hypothetical protein